MDRILLRVLLLENGVGQGNKMVSSYIDKKKHKAENPTRDETNPNLWELHTFLRKH